MVAGRSGPSWHDDTMILQGPLFLLSGVHLWYNRLDFRMVEHLSAIIICCNTGSGMYEKFFHTTNKSCFDKEAG